MNNKNIIDLVDFFNKAPKADDKTQLDFFDVNQYALENGYLIHPDCCTQIAIDWIDRLPVDYNSTFYKEWHDVTNKDRFEIFEDQLIHYATTYGTDFSFGNGYVPNDGSKSPSLKNLKVIEPITYEDLFKECCFLVKSGIALSKTTLKAVCGFIVDYIKEDLEKRIDLLDINEVKNKEAFAYLSLHLKKFPSDEFSLLRCLVYQYTDSTILIKNKKAISDIKESALDFDNLPDVNHPLLNLSSNDLKNLSKIFYRFKPLFLAMKTKKTASIINKIRKLAIKNHTPMKKGFWETIVSDQKSYKEIEDKIDELDNFRKVRILQAINVALYSNENSKIYTIRNGKIFVRNSYNPQYNKEYLRMIRPIFENSLIESLSKKACKVNFPYEFNITVPSSEKTFVGNYPIYTSIRIGENGIVGINWKNSDGTRDFDLSMLTLDGNKLGWNSNFYNDDMSVIYSGDMTNANPDATELFYIKDYCPDSIVKINQFNGEPISKFLFFVATEVLDYKDMKNHMVDENHIRFKTFVDIDNEKEKTMGFVHKGILHLMNLTSGSGRVSIGGKYFHDYIETISERTKCALKLKDILLRAGFVEDKNNPDIDFNNISKTEIIKLFSNN